MDKYTWDDVIINPNSEQAKACIGKEVYCADSPHYCLEKANGYDIDDMVYILQKILPDDNYPFRLGENAEYEHCCIIPKKEEPKLEYIPFTSKCEFIDECDDVHGNLLDLNLDYAFLSYRGIWLKDKKTEEIKLVSGITKDGLYVNGNYVKWENLLSDYIFLDDSPCGRPKEYKHESNSFLHQFF